MKEIHNIPINDGTDEGFEEEESNDEQSDGYLAASQLHHHTTEDSIVTESMQPTAMIQSSGRQSALLLSHAKIGTLHDKAEKS